MLLNEHADLFSYFVVGAPAMLKDNIATHRGLTNGAFVYLHSLVPGYKQESSEGYFLLDGWTNMEECPDATALAAPHVLLMQLSDPQRHSGM